MRQQPRSFSHHRRALRTMSQAGDLCYVEHDPDDSGRAVGALLRLRCPVMSIRLPTITMPESRATRSCTRTMRPLSARCVPGARGYQLKGAASRRSSAVARRIVARTGPIPRRYSPNSLSKTGRYSTSSQLEPPTTRSAAPRPVREDRAAQGRSNPHEAPSPHRRVVVAKAHDADPAQPAGADALRSLATTNRSAGASTGMPTAASYCCTIVRSHEAAPILTTSHRPGRGVREICQAIQRPAASTSPRRPAYERGPRHCQSATDRLSRPERMTELHRVHASAFLPPGLRPTREREAAALSDGAQ
jgi:hypothetical protein